MEKRWYTSVSAANNYDTRRKPTKITTPFEKTSFPPYQCCSLMATACWTVQMFTHNQNLIGMGSKCAFYFQSSPKYLSLVAGSVSTHFAADCRRKIIEERERSTTTTLLTIVPSFWESTQGLYAGSRPSSYITQSYTGLRMDLYQPSFEYLANAKLTTLANLKS